MPKLTVTCFAFKPLQKNTLQGFAEMRIEELRLVFHDVMLHRSNGRAWVSLPAKPWLDKDGVAIKDDHGKIKYQPLIEFEDAAYRQAFSDRCVEAIDKFVHGGL